MTYSRESNEVYTSEVPATWAAEGVTDFGSLCRRVLSLRAVDPPFVGVPVGVVFDVGHARAGQIDVNPPNDRPIVGGDQIVLICRTAPDLSQY